MKEKKKTKGYDKATILIMLGLAAVFALYRMNMESGVYDDQVEEITQDGRPQVLYVIATGLIRRETGLGLDTEFVEFEGLHKFGRHGDEYLFGGYYTRPDGVSVGFEVTLVESQNGIELAKYTENKVKKYD